MDKTNKEASSEIAEAQLQTGEAILITASDVFYLTWIVGRPSSNVKIICPVNLQNMLLVYTECWLK